MRQYKITVNGQVYDVTVEELGAAYARPAPVQVQAPQAAQAPAPAVPAPAPAPQAAAPSGPVAATVKAPMPGTVLSYKVEPGQQVRRGEVLLILEAMKMENEIVAPQDGKVASLRASAGSSVNTGDPLVDLA